MKAKIDNAAVVELIEPGARLHGADFPSFTTKHILQFTGIKRTTLHNWIERGVLSPKNARPGRGKATLFSTADLVAISAGIHFRKLGCDEGYSLAVVKLLSDLGSKLVDELDAGRTWVSPGFWVGNVHVPGRMVEPPAPENLAAAQAELLRKLDTRRIVNQLFQRIGEALNKSSETKKKSRKK